jgi:hypothetical protein
LVYEPRAAQKGNAARAIMYMAVCYNFPLNGNISSTVQNAQTLLNWHYADLPDNYEIARHEYVFNLQGNRNPFIDSVDFACHVNIDDNSYTACSISIEEKVDANLSVFPIPSNGNIYVQVNGTVISGYEIIDMNGKVVNQKASTNHDVLILNAADYSKGVYQIKVSTPYGEATRKLIIE